MQLNYKNKFYLIYKFKNLIIGYIKRFCGVDYGSISYNWYAKRIFQKHHISALNEEFCEILSAKNFLNL